MISTNSTFSSSLTKFTVTATKICRLCGDEGRDKGRLNLVLFTLGNHKLNCSK